MINDDKTFYHKALVWSVFFVLGDKTTCYCLSSLRNISSPYFTLNRKFGAASLNKHNRCNSDCSFNKNKGRPKDYPLWEKYSTNICNTRHINTVHKLK